MADEPQTKIVNLPNRVTFEDRNYGPGEEVVVPADFPEASEDDEPQSFPPPVFRKPASTPPNTGGVDTGEPGAREAVSGGVTPAPVPTTRVSPTPLTTAPTPDLTPE